MHKIPCLYKFRVEPNMQVCPEKSNLEPGLLFLDVEVMVAEDPKYRVTESFVFKIGGEKPPEGTLLGHLEGDIVKAIEEVQRLLVKAAHEAGGILRYEELPDDMKKVCADPSKKEYRAVDRALNQPIAEVKNPESIPQMMLSKVQGFFNG